VILEEILARRRQDVQESKKDRPLFRADVPHGAHRLRASLTRPGAGLICEIKKASPSRGPIDLDVHVPARAKDYEQSGARAISVLTEPYFFRGSFDDLSQAARAVEIPVLCKDFVVDEYQILKAALSGAAGILLIVAALRPDELRSLGRMADGLGLDCLVEVHTEEELEIALESEASIIGVNNRNLATLKVDLGVSERLIPKIPSTKLSVVESGISRPEDVVRLCALGARAFLIGESLMTAGNPVEKVRELAAALGPPSS